MNAFADTFPSLTHAWGVLWLFLIPVGGGIPAGVILAKDHGLAWPTTALLYFISDVMLATVLEPTILLIVTLGKKWKKLHRFNEAFRQSMEKTSARYSKNPRPLALVLISFGVDPMTGRLATAAAGHGFITGWFLAIIGDMIYFALLMASTLWLNGILGDGTLTTVIIMVMMFAVPWLWKKSRTQWGQR
jgi:hypothetical protein